MRRPVQGLVICCGLAAPGVAEAHLVVTGLGPAYDGAVHLVTSLQDLPPLACLGLYAGRRGPLPSRLILMACPAAFALGVLAAHLGLGLGAVAGATTAAVALMALGALLALDAPLSPALLPALGVLLGAARGLSAPAGDAGLSAACGATAAVLVVLALAASLTLPLRSGWSLIAARIAGSWAAALGLLLGGWLLRYGTRAL